MLRKLLKYDMKAISKLWWIGAVISLVASIIGAVLIRFFAYVTEIEDPDFFLSLIAIIALIVSFFCIIAVFITFAFTMVLVFARFYKHFFTDEGYLTFTLPVKRSTLLFSKTVNAVIWLSAHFAVIVISLLLFALLVFSPTESNSFINFMIFKEIGAFFAQTWASIGAWLIVYILEALLIVFVYLMFYVLLVYFCITFGSMLVKKAKLILSIVIYYAFSACLSAIGQLGVLLFGGLMSSDSMVTLMNTSSTNRICAIYTFLILAIAAALATITALLYSAIQYMLDRKLNLA